MKLRPFFGAFLFLTSSATIWAEQPAPPSPPLATIELTCVDANATGYGTFQSHNQKLVANRRGIFMTHLRTRNEAYTAQQWRLSWGHDGGTSFETLYEATNATNPPVLETDADDNLYLVRPDFVDNNAYLYRFLAAANYRDPIITKIPNAAAGKYCLTIDLARKQLYFFPHNNTFHRLDFEGKVLSSINLMTNGKHAALQYPHLRLDGAGTLHAAWTTVKHNVYLYWDIHYLRSPDGGVTWQTMNGKPVAPPFAADDTGPTDRITLDDEYEVHTWLESFFVRGGKAHFLYLAQTTPPRQHYMRYDVKTGRRELDMQPNFKGNNLALRGLDGFFATNMAKDDATIYAISRDANSNRLACLASNDNGTSWHDYAVSPPVGNPYSIGGCRQVTPDGWILGSYTDQATGTGVADTGAKVYFFRLKAK